MLLRQLDWKKKEILTTELSGDIFTQGVETTNKVTAGRCTADVEHVRSWMISLHVRDRHLRGLIAVAKQQPYPFFQSLFFFFFIFSHWCLPLKGEALRKSFFSCRSFYYLTILPHRLWTVHKNLQPQIHSHHLWLKTSSCEADLDCNQVRLQ